MKPKNYRPRKGDVVMVPAVVKFDSDPEDDAVHITIGYASSRIPIADICSVTRRAWEPRDRVRSLASALDRGVVIAVADAHVWVKLEPSGAFRTFDDIGLTDDEGPTSDLLDVEPQAAFRVFAVRSSHLDVVSGDASSRFSIQRERAEADEESKS